MPRAPLNGDCFISIAGWCLSLGDVVRLWIALGRIIPTRHVMWKRILRQHVSTIHNENLDDIIYRLGCRLDSTGLLLIERMYVERKCSHSGCFKSYREIENTLSSCTFHNGILRKGRLSCCRQSTFRDVGCKRGYHDGALYEILFAQRDEAQAAEEESAKKEELRWRPPSPSPGQRGMVVVRAEDKAGC